MERFKNAYREIARKLKIPGYQSPESDTLRLVKDCLEDDESGQWLMILDNADDAEIMYGSESLRLADYLPKSHQGSILLTTRFQKVGSSFATTRSIMSLQQMTLEESESLIRARLGDESQGQNQDLYQELATELERTPLALVQATSFMSQNCIPLEVYLRMYRESDVSKIRLLSENFQDDIRDSEAKNPIATTWIISFDYIRIHVPQAAELLSLMSIMDAQNIPDFLVPQGEDAISFNRAIGTLEAFSFIAAKKQYPGPRQQYRLFNLHRLVRLAIRNWLKMNDALDQRTAQVLKVLGSMCMENSSRTFEMSSLILPHAIEVLAADLLQCTNPPSQTLKVEALDRPSLSDLHSVSMTNSIHFRERILLLEKVDTIANLMDHTAELLLCVTYGLRDVRNNVEARIFATNSVAISTRARGQSDKDTLFCMDVLAGILMDLGEHEHAERLKRQIVTICESEYGLQHILTLDYLLALGSFLALKKRDQEAVEMDRIAIQRCQESLLIHEGEEHHEILSMLAGVQSRSGEFEEAERSARRALHGYEAANQYFGILEALRNLSDNYDRQDKWRLAVDTKRTELDVSIRHHGQSHPITMFVRSDLTRVLLKDRKIEEAREQASLALELIGQVYDSSSDTYAYHYREYDELFSAYGELLSPQGQFHAIDSTVADVSASHAS